MAVNNAGTSRDDLSDLGVGAHVTDMTGGVFLGLGIGGFINGIFFHQIAQWHTMGSTILPPTTVAALAQNMRWDGLFYILMLVMTLIGVVSLWSECKNGTLPPVLRVLMGQMILGWGVFNLVEGFVMHHLVELHHVRDLPMHVPVYDWIYLGVCGGFFILLGWFMSRTTEQDFLY
jgi:uncharacterized membrane protein